MRVMNGFLENRKPSPWAHEAETRKAAGKMLFSEGLGKWGSDAFTQSGRDPGETRKVRGRRRPGNKHGVANNREPCEFLL